MENIEALQLGIEEKIVWKLNNRGNYIVKSAYHFAMEKIIDDLEFRVPSEAFSLESHRGISPE